MEGVHFNWRGGVSYGGGAFQLEGGGGGGGVSYGEGMFQMEGV